MLLCFVKCCVMCTVIVFIEMCEFCGNVTPTVVAADVQENGRGVSHFVHSACIVSCPQVEAHLLAAAALLFDLIVILYWIV